MSTLSFSTSMRYASRGMAELCMKLMPLPTGPFCTVEACPEASESSLTNFPTAERVSWSSIPEQ